MKNNIRQFAMVAAICLYCTGGLISVRLVCNMSGFTTVQIIIMNSTFIVTTGTGNGSICYNVSAAFTAAGLKLLLHLILRIVSYKSREGYQWHFLICKMKNVVQMLQKFNFQCRLSVVISQLIKRNRWRDSEKNNGHANVSLPFRRKL